MRKRVPWGVACVAATLVLAFSPAPQDKDKVILTRESRRDLPDLRRNCSCRVDYAAHETSVHSYLSATVG